MAKKKSVLATSTFKKKFAQALTKHKGDEAKAPEGGDLPSGITGGIARLNTCEFTKVKEGGKNAGKPQFYADAIVVSPKTFKGMSLEGGRTFIAIPLYNTPTRKVVSAEGHLIEVMDMMKLMGAPVKDLEPDDLVGLEELAEELAKAKPFIKFDTWAGKPTEEYPDPQVRHRWKGLAEGFEDEDEDEVDEEESEDDEEDDDEESEEESSEDESEDEEDSDEEEDEDEVDLDDLAAQADEDDEDAQQQLNEIALKAGVKKGAIKKATNWSAVADMIREAQGEESEDEEEEEEEESEESEAEAPELGGTYSYCPMGTKGKRLKPVQVIVKTINESKETCTLETTKKPKKTYKNIPFADVESEPY